MSMAYIASFDLARLQPGTLTLSSSGVSDVELSLTTFTVPGVNSDESSRFNMVIGAPVTGFDRYGIDGYPALGTDSFFNAVQDELQVLAAAEAWPDASSIRVRLDYDTWRVTFSYDNDFTAIAFSTTECRRLFGFSGDFSGSSDEVTGTQLPKYILLPTVAGASSATHVYDDAASSMASSGSGWPHGLMRSVQEHKRDWQQAYETRARMFRRYADSAPDEYTFQDLYESRLPFAVWNFGDDVDESFQVYALRGGSESFEPKPATPGNADQFHLPFRTVAIGKVAFGYLVNNGDPVVVNDIPVVLRQWRSS